MCPACGGGLDVREDDVSCSTCGATYGSVNGVPLLAPPELSGQHAHQRAYFDDEFSGYTEYCVETWRKSFNDRIFSALDLGPDRGPYLDVGVGGSGATVIEAARSGVEAVGCDLSVEGVVHASRFAQQQGVTDKARFVVCAAERLPFPAGSMGSASAVAVLEHLEDDGIAVDELARVVRPGGRVWITVPHAYRHMPLPVWPVYWLHDRRIGHKRHYDDAHLRRLFAERGFRHVETQFSGHPVKLLQVLASVLGRRTGLDVSALWWRLERRDLRTPARRRGALQLSAVFERVADAP